jgi:hypothetical protein
MTTWHSHASVSLFAKGNNNMSIPLRILWWLNVLSHIKCLEQEWGTQIKFFCLVSFEAGSFYVAQVGLKLMILLPQSPGVLGLYVYTTRAGQIMPLIHITDNDNDDDDNAIEFWAVKKVGGHIIQCFSNFSVYQNPC